MSFILNLHTFSRSLFFNYYYYFKIKSGNLTIFFQDKVIILLSVLVGVPTQHILAGKMVQI